MPPNINEQAFKEIGNYAVEIYRRMIPGSTIQLNWPESKVIIPGDPTPRDGGFLIISKPTMMVGLNVAPSNTLPPANQTTKG